MKSLSLLALISVLTAFEAKAFLFKTHYYYINVSTLKKIDVISINDRMAQYYNYDESRYEEVSVDQLSRESHEGIDGIQKGQVVLVTFSDKSEKPCEVWHTYMNGYSHVGCQTGKLTKNVGVSRPELKTIPVHKTYITKETDSLEGYEKGDKVRLLSSVGDLKEGDTVQIKRIFEKGKALVQLVNVINTLDTSGVLMEFNTQVLDLKDLSR